jgi:hypothetical protein
MSQYSRLPGAFFLWAAFTRPALNRGRFLRLVLLHWTHGCICSAAKELAYGFVDTPQVFIACFLAGEVIRERKYLILRCYKHPLDATILVSEVTDLHEAPLVFGLRQGRLQRTF